MSGVPGKNQESRRPAKKCRLVHGMLDPTCTFANWLKNVSIFYNLEGLLKHPMVFRIYWMVYDLDMDCAGR